ncbi:MAG: TetR/AcrR family transcriptional regulator [bacterium]|nr:TetR/AcrR family transcriptional regulator [bacterium]
MAKKHEKKKSARSGKSSPGIRRKSGTKPAGADKTAGAAKSAPAAKPAAAAGKSTAASKTGRTKQEQREATRKLLLKIAREEFHRQGFAGAATERIVERAQVTRGALYHQFKDKQDLFRAVFIEAQLEIVAAIGVAVEKSTDGWGALVDGCRAFLAAATAPDLQRIVLVDGPSVLGINEWRRLDDEHSFQELMIGVGEVMQAGLLPRLPLEPLARMLSGAMNEAVLYCAGAANPARAVKESQATIVELLEALRARA